jgi:hypothetical protein
MAKTSAMGRPAFFEKKIRQRPLTCSLTAEQWRIIDATSVRLKLSKSDVVGLLLEKHGAKLTIPAPRRSKTHAEDEDD